MMAERLSITGGEDMLGTALYYPHIDILDAKWLRSAVLFWDEIQTIAPTSVQTPYHENDTKICEKEGYLRPLRCDLHQDVLETLGKRVLKLMEEPEWARSVSNGRSGGPVQQALMHADKLGHVIRSGGPVQQALMHADKLGLEIRWRMEEMVGIRLDNMRPELRTMCIQSFTESGGLELLSARESRLAPRRWWRRRRMHPERLSRELRHLRTRDPHHEQGDWVLVDGRFANIYMSALAALLAREIDISPLTNEEPSLGVNLRCLIDDVTASGPTAARGALVSVVMEGLRVDPETPIERLLNFRRGRRDQLAELSGKFDVLKSSIEKSTDGQEIENKAKRVFENEIRPALAKLKNELRDQAIGSAWEGFQTAATFSAAPSTALWATGFPAPVALGVGAFITAAGIGIKSYLACSKARAASPYTYLLDVERKFSLPAY